MRSMTKGCPHTTMRAQQKRNSSTANGRQDNRQPADKPQTITSTGGSNMTNTYNDVPEVERETADGIRTVSLLTDALTGRKVFLFGNIDENLVFSFTMQMFKLMEDVHSEINI